MDELQPTTRDEVSVETEWRRVEQLLEGKDDASWGMAVVEAFKIFHQVLDEVSFGGTAEDKIHNAGELFRDVRGVLSAEKVYRHILTEAGHRVKKSDANKSCTAFLQAILDMIGRDWEERSWWDRWTASLNYFWGTHPRLLAGGLALILLAIVITWFFTETDLGTWLLMLWVGFANFILNSPVVLGLIMMAMLVSALLGLAFSDRHHK